MASIKWLQGLVASNVIWKLCPLHQVAFTTSQQPPAACSGCDKEPDRTFTVGLETTEEAGYASYYIHYGPALNEKQGFTWPLNVCHDCYAQMRDLISGDWEVLRSVISDYLYRAIVKCPFD